MAYLRSSLIYDVNTAKLRVGLRIYLTALFLILGYVGDQIANAAIEECNSGFLDKGQW
jgi:hypothetical protein